MSDASSESPYYKSIWDLWDFQKINYSLNNNDNHFKGGMKGLPTRANASYLLIKTKGDSKMT
jgi:hypothetical protein